MGVNSLPKTVTRQRRVCDLNPGPSAPESSTLTTRLPSHSFRTDDRYKSLQRFVDILGRFLSVHRHITQQLSIEQNQDVYNNNNDRLTAFDPGQPG